MCGILGFSGFPQPELLKYMSDLLRHRGPDGSGSYQDPQGRMNLGHRRLSIIDLVTGDQPMSNENGRVWIVFNGEIYNYQELQPPLRAAGHQLATTSDTEVVLHLYEEYGLKFLEHLNGMFALALWDEERQTLLLARDRLGVKPLYWAEVAGRLVFASEMKSILCWPDFIRDMDPRAFSLYLSLRNVPEPLTIYRGLHALPPAHYLIWKPGEEPRLGRYWSLDFAPRPWPDEEALADGLEELLLDATRLRMRADVPVGAYLSGGVDSSLAVALVRQFFSGCLHTFSLGYADEPEDKVDTFYARRLAQQYRTDHHEYIMSAQELADALPDVVRHLDQPFAGVLSTYFLTGLVRQYVKVVLSGDGADDQFGSYGHHRLVWPLARLAQARAQGINDPYAVVDLAPLAARPDYVRGFEGLEPWAWRARFGAFPDEDKFSLLSPEFKSWVQEYSAEDFLAACWRRGTAQDPLNATLEVDIQTLLPNEVLFFVDRLSMAHSVEARSPYLDYRIAELAASIPGTLKIKGNTLKYILKKVAARYLPDEIIQRPKEGFVLPNHVWLRSQLNGLLQDLLAPGELAKHGFFDPRQVNRLIREHQQQVRDHAFRIWSLIMFQMWYNTYLESPQWPEPCTS